MTTTTWKSFVHPHRAYRLEFPAHWEHRVEDEGKSCGFGPYDRDDVGLWISILPFSVDTDELAEVLPRMFRESLQQSEAANLREDPTLHHHGLKADMIADDQGGHYWIIAGGDLVLFASSQVPPAEKDAWNPQFERLMSSLQITRDDELVYRKLVGEVIERLREKFPDQDYSVEEKGIRGKNHMVYLDNLYRQVLEDPDDQDDLVERFVEAITPMADSNLGYEQWDDILENVLPVLKPLGYIKDDGPTKHLHTAEWLADILICYVIRAEKTFRFITGWDLNRWGIDGERLHEVAIRNLAKLEWPEKLQGARQPGGGRLILVTPSDSFAASRLLHPELPRLFSQALGSPFLAGIPDRDTLVTFSNKRSLKKRVVRQIRKDHDKSAYPITPRIFLVTPDGIALASSG